MSKKEYKVTRTDLKERKRPTILLLDANNIFWRTAAVAIKNYNDPMKDLRQKILNETATPGETKHYDMYYDEFKKIWKNICFSMIRNIVNTHKPNSVIICCDAGYSWREIFFPYYKGMRKINKKENDKIAAYDMSTFYKEITAFTDELESVLNYHTMKCEYCEADDIIAVISQKLHKEFDIIISSTDKDFADLITEDGSIKFWEHNKKEFLSKDDKLTFDEMIFMGDVADGIPRLHDSDDSIVMYRDYTEEEMKLTEEERESIKREFVKSPSEMRSRFGIASARKILKKCAEDGITLREYSNKKGISVNYLRNRILFSLRLDDLTAHCPQCVDIITTTFSNLNKTKQSFIAMQKFFAMNKFPEQLNRIEEFILPEFKK